MVVLCGILGFSEHPVSGDFAEVWKDRQRWEFLLGDIGGWVQDVIGYWGAFGLVFLLFLENLFPPIPSELILPLAGFLVGREELGWVQALVGSTTGSLLGAYVLYGLGRWGGRPLVLRFGRVLRVTERELDRAERWFDRFGSAVVLFARMLPGARSVVSIPAGTLQMPLGRFTVLTVAGSALWNTLLIGAGYLLGENWSRVEGAVGSISNVLVVIVLISVVGLTIRWFYSKKHKSES
ncbi:MAG: DedA family protein [Rubrobacteraceae bacterium]